MQRPIIGFDWDWQVVDGTLCVVFIGKDDLQQERRIAVPAVMIPMKINPDARRRIAASQIEQARVEKFGHWNQIRCLQASTLEVGITDANSIGIIFDPGTETEFALSLAPDTARQLGQRLIENADKASGKAVSVN